MIQVETYPRNRRGSHVPQPASQPTAPVLRSPINPPLVQQPYVAPETPPPITTTTTTQNIDEPPASPRKKGHRVIISLALVLLVGATYVLANAFRPYCDDAWWCVPCPLNGWCSTHEVKCAEGYKVVGGWLRSAQCVKDLKQAGRCLMYLRNQAATNLCEKTWRELWQQSPIDDFCQVHGEETADRAGCNPTLLYHLEEEGHIKPIDNSAVWFYLPTSSALKVAAPSCRLKYFVVSHLHLAFVFVITHLALVIMVGSILLVMLNFYLSFKRRATQDQQVR